MGTVAIRRAAQRHLRFESPIAGPLITLLTVFILFSLLVPQFLTMRSISGIVNAATLSGVVTIGVTLLMIAGEFDLSVGSLMAIGAFLYGFNIVNGGNPLWALFLGLLIPALLGALNGLILIRTGIPSFIITLGTQFIYRGALWVYSTGQMIQTVEHIPLYDILNGRLGFLADAVEEANFRTAALWLLGLVLLFQYLLTRTRFGNHVFATGGNVSAAAAQGVNTKRVKLICFVLSGLLAGFAGILLFSQYKTARIATGAGEELKAIASAVVGGTLLSGGSGSIIGALLGVLTISTLRTGVVLADLVPADNFEAIVGVTIVGAAIFNNWIRSRS
ncbi:MAG: ABC transporter permease [Anaerolineae bacterium]|nr:ABC transporter permease [Anaerolineae bacterium]MDW8100400.1 ABC transporter permease [Anaerolineae bacterium]